MKIKIFLMITVMLCLASSAHAATYYVSVNNGSDSNPGTEGAPFKTILKASRAMSGGDTVYIRAGVYNEGLTHGYGSPDKFVFKNGTSKNNMTRFAAYPGEEALAHGYSKSDAGKVIIKPPRGWMGPRPQYGGATFALLLEIETQYVEIRGLVFDGTNSLIPGTSQSHGPVKFNGSDDKNSWAKNNRLIANEIRYGMGILGGGGNEIIGNWIHHATAYGIYTMNFDTQALFEGNLVEDNNGYGLHLFSQYHHVNGWVIRNNIFRRNGGNYHPEGVYRNGLVRTGELKPLPSVILTRGSSQFYNNLVYDNPYGGVNVSNSANNMFVANNTVYGNGKYGILIRKPEPPEQGGSRNARVINNISYGNSGPQIEDNGINTTLQNNMTSDPLFWDAANGDFGLKLLSPAIDAGATLPEVKTDFIGNPRPDGPNYDIGAFEASGSHPNPAPGAGGGIDGGTGGSPPCCV